MFAYYLGSLGGLPALHTLLQHKDTGSYGSLLAHIKDRQEKGLGLVQVTGKGENSKGLAEGHTE